MGGIEMDLSKIQVGCKEGRSTLGHILTLRTLIEQEVFAS